MEDASVSRETPPPPELAAEVFASALPLAVRYVDLLATAGVERGLIGPREVPRLWERHLLNCAVLAEGIPERSSVCDLGSGAGLPGVALALARPDLAVSLVEPLLRRSLFLAEVVEQLGLHQVEVVRARAEDLHGVRQFDVVTARAVAPLERLAGWALPLVRRGGLLLAMKGASAEQELRAARPALDRLGGLNAEVVRYGVGKLALPTTALRVEAAGRSSLPSGSGRRKQQAPSKSGRKRGR